VESVTKMKVAATLTETALKELKPATVAGLIKSGINPLDLDMEELLKRAKEINEKVIALYIKGGKITARLLQKAMKIFLAEIKKQEARRQLPHGKQSLKQLMKQNAGVSNIEITDENIKAFDDFKDLLKNEALMRELRSECILATIKKNIPEYIDHPYGCTIYRKWNNDFAITCYIYELNISYGFITLEDEPQFSTDTRKKLKEVLNTDCFNKFSNEEVQEGGQNPEWIFRNFDKDDINNYTTQEIVDMVTKVLRLLEEKSKHLLEDSNTV